MHDKGTANFGSVQETYRLAFYSWMKLAANGLQRNKGAS